MRASVYALVPTEKCRPPVPKCHFLHLLLTVQRVCRRQNESAVAAVPPAPPERWGAHNQVEQVEYAEKLTCAQQAATRVHLLARLVVCRRLAASRWCE